MLTDTSSKPFRPLGQDAEVQRYTISLLLLCYASCDLCCVEDVGQLYTSRRPAEDRGGTEAAGNRTGACSCSAVSSSTGPDVNEEMMRRSIEPVCQ